MTGGTGVFGLFLEIGFDAFHLSRAGKVMIPGGRPVFPQVPGRTPEEVLTGHGLVPGPLQVLDAMADATLVTWQAPANPRIPSSMTWIGECTRRPRLGSGGALRRLHMPRAKDVEDGFAGCNEIIRDDAPMASPPHGFGAHDGAAPGVTEFPQFGQSASEGVAHCVVSVMVKALFPKKR